jgi:hypothetical protein
MTFLGNTLAFLAAFTAVQSTERPGPATRITYRDKLQHCVSIKLGREQLVENVALFEATLRISRTLQRCGCATTALRYESFIPYPEGARDVLARGRLESKDRVGGSVSIMLVGASDTAGELNPNKLRIELKCEVPRLPAQPVVSSPPEPNE